MCLVDLPIFVYASKTGPSVNVRSTDILKSRIKTFTLEQQLFLSEFVLRAHQILGPRSGHANEFSLLAAGAGSFVKWGISSDVTGLLINSKVGLCQENLNRRGGLAFGEESLCPGSRACLLQAGLSDPLMPWVNELLTQEGKKRYKE